MTYETPQIHEVGMAEEVIQGAIGLGSDMWDLFEDGLLLEDFDE